MSNIVPFEEHRDTPAVHSRRAGLPVESGDDIFAAFLHAGHVAAFCGRAKDDLIGLPLAAPQAVPA